MSQFPILDEIHEARLADPREREDPRRRIDPREIAENERIPLGGNAQKLTIPEIPGYHTHLINDEGDRLERALRGGYEFIPKAGMKAGSGPEPGHTDLGSVMSKVVGTHPNGQPKRGYWMKIKLEWYNADQIAKLAPVRESEEDIKRGNAPAREGDTSNRYIPEEGINIETQ